jgi:hypothetical protein
MIRGRNPIISTAYNALNSVHQYVERVMSKKLTLRLDEDVIERAKRYADERGTSVSQLVEQYFVLLTEEETDREGTGDEEENWRNDLSPFTRRLLNRAPSSDVDEEDYYRYLEEKHQ